MSILSIWYTFIASIALVLGIYAPLFAVQRTDKAAARERARQQEEVRPWAQINGAKERQKAAARERARQQEEEERQKAAARERARQQEEEERQEAAARKRQKEQEEAAARERARQQEEQQRRHNSFQGKLSQRQALEILGLETGATEQEIRAAYGRLMKRVHPDLGGSNFFAKQLNEARDLLLG
jgi:hypothetical protein